MLPKFRRNNEQSSSEPHKDEMALVAAASPETVAQLAGEVELVWGVVRSSKSSPNIFPGYTTNFDDRTLRASVLLSDKKSSSHATRITVFPDSDGQWSVERQQFRPNDYSDDVDFSIIRETNTYPVAFGAVSSSVKDVCRKPQNDWDDVKVIRRVDDIRVGEPVSEGQALNMAEGLRQLLESQQAAA